MKDPFEFGTAKVRMFHDISKDIQELSSLSDSLSSTDKAYTMITLPKDPWFSVPHTALLGSALATTQERLQKRGLGSQAQKNDGKENMFFKNESVTTRLTASAVARRRQAQKYLVKGSGIRSEPSKPCSALDKGLLSAGGAVKGRKRGPPRGKLPNGQPSPSPEPPTGRMQRAKVHSVASKPQGEKKLRSQQNQQTVKTGRKEQLEAFRAKRAAKKNLNESKQLRRSPRLQAKHQARTAANARSARSTSARNPSTGRRSQQKTQSSAPSGLNDSSDDFSDLQELLARHNKKFKPVHTYEPRKHSLKDVKQWEKMTGKSYNSLNVQERRVVNDEISRLFKKKRT